MTGNQLLIEFNMKKSIYLLFIVFLICSCGKKLPENYGIYVYSINDYHQLKPQNTFISGNLLQSISGIKGTSGAIYEKMDYLIIFEQNIKPDDIKISKLRFNRGGYVRNLFGESYTEVNLWTSERELTINIAPVEGKKDIYKVTTTQPLDKGFYAIHFGSLTNQNTYSALNKVAYDFVIGTNGEDYQPYEEVVRKNENAFLSNATELLKKINEYFNNKNYEKVRQIYVRPDGNKFDDNEWSSLTNGFDNWILQNGKIKSSQIINKSINENYGSFSLQTEYEKGGIVNEELNVIKKGDSYYITFIGIN
ncbi:MAG: hypothetical protein M0P61_11770 [Ignavibacteriaceae bacterium]|jgi:hypothetical protein|nr:hypothetical protein [Ignavibacteriaceae bacterium]